MQKEQFKKILKKSEAVSLSLVMLVFSLIYTLAGSAMNLQVMDANGGKMPVHITEYVYNDAEHFTFAEKNEIKYPFLADTIYLGEMIYSPGDLIIYSGGIAVAISLICMMLFNFQLGRMKRRYKWLTK